MPTNIDKKSQEALTEAKDTVKNTPSNDNKSNKDETTAPVIVEGDEAEKVAVAEKVARTQSAKPIAVKKARSESTDIVPGGRFRLAGTDTFVDARGNEVE